MVLDGIDELPEGYRIRSHDPRRPLPDILVPRLETWELKERVALDACKLNASAVRGETQT